MEGWAGNVQALGWDPECPLEDASGKCSVVGKLLSVHGNWHLLHNRGVEHSCVTLALLFTLSEPHPPSK